MDLTGPPPRPPPPPLQVQELEARGAGDMVVVIGGVIPPEDYEFLREAGCALIFGPGTRIPAAAQEILDSIPPGAM